MTSQKYLALCLGLLVIFILGGCDTKPKETQKPFRLNEPRLTPLTESQWDEKQGELLTPYKNSDGKIMNVFTTVVRHPGLFERFMPFASYVIQEQTLPARDREMLILRIGWLCQAKYEFGQHTLAAKEVGLSDEEILRITRGPDDPEWNEFESALLRAADELFHDAIIADSTWNTLSRHYEEKQLMDIVFTLGQYNMVSWMLNSFGVQLEEGVPGFPEGAEGK